MPKLPTLLTGGILLITQLITAQTPAQATFENTNLRAVVNANGALFTDFQQGQFIPLQPGLAEKTLLRGSGIWMAGRDATGVLHGAIQLGSQSDFQPGGLTADNQQPYEANKIWRVTGADIAAHVADFEDNGQIDSPNAAVFDWPGNGNPYSSIAATFTNQGLAGYDDYNQDGQYLPTAGDFPSIEIRGCPLNRYPDDMGWFVNNDLDTGQPHPSGLEPLSMEVQTQLFTYQVEPASNLMNNVVFVRYKLINRSDIILDSVYMGTYTDFSIGNPDDDFIGSNQMAGLIYAYNSDANDEGGFGANVPVMAVGLLRGPLVDTGNDAELRHFVVLNTTENLSGAHFYNVLSGKMPDGTPAPENGWMFPGNPNNPLEVSEVSTGSTPGHRVGVGSYGPFTLNPGAVNELIVAYYYVHEPGFTPLQNVQLLYEQAGQIPQTFFNNCFSGELNASAEPQLAPDDLRLYPSPATTELTVESKGASFSRIDVVDMLGRFVQHLELDEKTQLYTLHTAAWPAGLYAVRVGGQTRTVVVMK